MSRCEELFEPAPNFGCEWAECRCSQIDPSDRPCLVCAVKEAKMPGEVLAGRTPWHVAEGDCIAGMRALPDLSLDVIITDPPYSKSTHEKQRRGCTGYVEPTRPNAKKAQFNRTRTLGFKPLDPVTRAKAAHEFERLCKRWILIFTDDEGAQPWVDDLKRFGLEVPRRMVWHKRGCPPQFTGDRPAIATEIILAAHRPGRKQWNGRGSHGFFNDPIVLNRSGKEPRLHTAQKPIALLLKLVRLFSNEGELVADPFAGSGTHGDASLQLRRRFLGWDDKAKNVKIARERLASVKGGA